jgi:hypothetical protein
VRANSYGCHVTEQISKDGIYLDVVLVSSKVVVMVKKRRRLDRPSIRVTLDTRTKLNALRRKGQTYDEIIKDLIRRRRRKK